MDKEGTENKYRERYRETGYADRSIRITEEKYTKKDHKGQRNMKGKHKIKIENIKK